MKIDISISSYEDNIRKKILDSSSSGRLIKLEKGVKLPMQISVMASGEGCGKTSFGNTQTREKSLGNGTMSNIYTLCEGEMMAAIEVIQDLMVLADCSEYLKEEAELVIEMLKGVDSMTTEAYIKLNELKEALQ